LAIYKVPLNTVTAQPFTFSWNEPVSLPAASSALPEIPGDYNGLRMGTQEITRWGKVPDDMPVVFEFLCRVLLGGKEPENVK
jgi:hypothetical protein